MEVFKEYLDAVSSRVRSPILGSITVSLIVFNWQSIFYLLASEESAVVRLRFVSLNTDFCWSIALPIGFGLATALCLPWLNYVGSKIVRRPVRLHRSLAAEDAMALKISRLEKEIEFEEKRAKLQAVREKAKIDAEKLLQEAKKVNPDLADAISEERAESSNESSDATEEPRSVSSTAASLSHDEKATVTALGQAQSNLSIDELAKDDVFRFNLKKSTQQTTIPRLRAIADAATATLRLKGVAKEASPGRFTLTEFGFRVSDHISK